MESAMRLPPPISQPVPVRLISIITNILIISLLGITPVRARAATPQLSCSSSALHFGSVVVGETETLLVTLANNGSSSVTVSNITLSNAEFNVTGVSLPMVLSSGQSASLSVIFAPTTRGWTGGSIDFVSNASNPTLQVKVTGTGSITEAVTASPASLSFGPQPVGSATTLPLVLSNMHKWSVSLAGMAIGGSGFSISGPSLPLTLTAGQSVSFNVTFTPQTTGAGGGSILVQGTGLTIPLTGTGATAVGTLTIAPSALNFGDVTVGNSGNQTLNVSAAGTAVTISSSASSSAQFALAGASFPMTIPAGQSVSLDVVFTPQNSGVVSGTLAFASNAANSTSSEPLTGTGTAPVYTVGLSWTGSTSSVMGYNVYRGPASSGPFSKINPSLNSSTAYTDGTVASGQTYYYVTTAVNSSNEESSPSAPAVAKIP
jgi:Abnormal spindle-like microcephaly-assoc'd, ASPM-SPD-2-Hydin